MTATGKLLREIQKLNPQLELRAGKSHMKLVVDGKLVCIVPYTPKKEGLAENTKAALRRAGLRLTR